MQTQTAPDDRPPPLIGPDGMPADENDRRIAAAMRFAMTRNFMRCWPGKPRHLIEAAVAEGRRERAKEVWKALEKAGSVRHEHGVWKFREDARLDPSTPGARTENFLAAARGVASRAFPEGRARGRCLDLFMRIRTVYAVHKLRVGEETFVAVPTRIETGRGGPVFSEGFAVAVGSRGLRAVRIPRGAAATSWRKGAVRLRIDPDACVPDPELQSALDAHHLSTFTSLDSGFCAKVAKMAKASVAPLRTGREACEEFIGRRFPEGKWKPFMASFARVPNLSTVFKRTLFGALDPAMRRAALRNPIATADSYTWLCGGERRVQASGIVPVLSPRLAGHEGAIDAGMPVFQILEKATGLPVPALKRMRGLTWQKIKGHGTYRVLSEITPDGHLSNLLRAVPPERLPCGREQWQAAADVAAETGRTTGWPAIPALARAAGLDWTAFASLVSSGLLHSISDVADALSVAAWGAWPETARGADERQQAAAGRTAMARAVARAVAGDGGTKRLRAFTDAWHRGEARRTALMASVRREATGVAALSWEPFTADGAFECPQGRIDWITDEDSLAAEGAVMKHCVGSYTRQCASGMTSIGSVKARDGTRSTVSVTAREGRLDVVQHRARGNADPSTACEATVEALAAAVRKGLATLAHPSETPKREDDLEETLEARRQAEVQALMSRSEPPDPETAAKIAEAFADCLPSAFRGLGARDWARLAEAEAAAGFSLPEPEGDAFTIHMG